MSDISSLQLVTDPLAILPGQAIECEYTTTSGVFGTFSNLGNTSKSVISDTTNPDGKFYFICIGYTPQGYPKLIADRNIQTNITFDAIYTLGTSFGTEITIGSNKFRVRLLGSAFQNDGTYSGEYDQNILKGLNGLSDADSIWNTSIASWTSTTPTVTDTAGTAATSTQMITRGGSTPEYITNTPTNTISPSVGFRPVLIVIPPKYTRGKIDCSLPLVTDIMNISPGKAISCEYTVTTAGNIGTFANLGNATKEPINDLSTSTPDGTFYFICVGYDGSGYPKLIADRNIQNNISYEVLSTAGYCTNYGLESTLGSKSRIRILNTISNRHPSSTNYGEWDAIISLYGSNGITASSNDIWNCKETLSWVLGSQDVLDDAGTANASGTLRLARGMQDTGYVIESQRKFENTFVSDLVGFRPVMLYTALPGSSRGRVSTSLTLSTSLKIITPGQAIACEYTATSGIFGTFNKLGSATKPNIVDVGEENPDGTFYFICVGYTPQGYPKLVADRNIQTNITWDILNNAGMCLSTGTEILINSKPGIWMRLLSTLSDRTLSSTNYGEWDAIISYLTNSVILTASDNNIWNCKNNASWTMSNIATIDDAGTLADYTYKIGRGNQSTGFVPEKQGKYLNNYTSESIGFRPMIYYNPVGPFIHRMYKTSTGVLYGFLDI